MPQGLTGAGSWPQGEGTHLSFFLEAATFPAQEVPRTSGPSLSL